MAGTLRVIDNLGNTKSRLSDAECKTISDLVVRTIKEANKKEPSYSPEQLEELLSRVATPERIRARTDNAYVVLYEEDGQLYGTGCLLNDPNAGWKMNSVYVDSKKQGHGIGKKIVAELQRKAKDIGVEIKRVYPNLFPSTIKFYEKLGYIKIYQDYAWGEKARIPGVILEKRPAS